MRLGSTSALEVIPMLVRASCGARLTWGELEPGHHRTRTQMCDLELEPEDGGAMCVIEGLTCLKGAQR